MNSEQITKVEQDGVTYYSTVRRGVEYTTYFLESAGKWFVSSHRIALGRMHIGGGKYVESPAECKAFAALPVLMEIGAI